MRGAAVVAAVALVLGTVPPVHADVVESRDVRLPDGLARTPPMGFNNLPPTPPTAL